MPETAVMKSSKQREGKIDQVSAATKKTIDKAADAVKDIVDPKK